MVHSPPTQSTAENPKSLSLPNSEISAFPASQSNLVYKRILHLQKCAKNQVPISIIETDDCVDNFNRRKQTYYENGILEMPTRLEITSVRVSMWYRKKPFSLDVVSEKSVKFRCGVGIFRCVPFPIPERKLFLTVQGFNRVENFFDFTFN